MNNISEANGLKIQWGNQYEKTVKLPISFSNVNYRVSITGGYNSNPDFSFGYKNNSKSVTQFVVGQDPNYDSYFDWFAIGY